jgi:hypothetical protein
MPGARDTPPRADREAVRFGSSVRALVEVASMTAVGNVRSRVVPDKARMAGSDEDCDHPGVPDGHPLKRQQCTD